MLHNAYQFEHNGHTYKIIYYVFKIKGGPTPDFVFMWYLTKYFEANWSRLINYSEITIKLTN